MRRPACLLLVWSLAALPAGTAAPAPPAALAALEDDGWYTWRVEAADGAPAWCCTARPGHRALTACDLDGGHHAYTACDDATLTGGEVQIYARMEAGEVADLRVLAPGCPVTSAEPASNLGLVDVTQSFDWLRKLVDENSEAGEDALAAIAVHRGDAALEYLVDAANGEAEGELREEAIFWLGQLRIAETAPVIEQLMFADDSADIRRHAAFVLAMSTFSGRHAALVRQGREDADAEVRAGAWFWLAQTGTDGSEQAIRRAMRDDPDPEVREEAVFALSQLPGERAVDALLEVVEDRGLEHALRKAALFWLVESESERAFASVERLLGDGSVP